MAEVACEFFVIEDFLWAHLFPSAFQVVSVWFGAVSLVIVISQAVCFPEHFSCC
jgi:hypothetical protein